MQFWQQGWKKRLPVWQITAIADWKKNYERLFMKRLAVPYSVNAAWQWQLTIFFIFGVFWLFFWALKANL
jgi:hypothetical protein